MIFYVFPISHISLGTSDLMTNDVIIFSHVAGDNEGHGAQQENLGR